MIVIASAFSLTEDFAATADNPLIGWRNIVTVDNVTASGGEDPDYPAVNLANPSTAIGQSWVSGSDATQYLTVLTGEVDDIDYLAVARHNFGSEQIVVSVEGRDSAIASFSELVGETLLADDSPVLFRFEPQGLYEVRLKMQPPGSPAPLPAAAVLYVGKLLILQRRIYVGHTPIPFGRRIQMTNGRSESGNFLGQIITGEFRDSAVTMQNLTPAWYREELDPFIAERPPFFFAWRPGDYPAEVGYAWITSEPKPVNQRSNGMMQIDWQMDGVV